MRTIIIDDEEGARSVLKNLLKRTCPEVEVIGMAANVPDGVKAIKAHKPDLVFLDVEMPDYAGYELVNFIDKIDFKIIFATAYDQYAIKAFELSAVDYLLKPINRQRLIQSVEKAKAQILTKKSMDEYKLLLDSVQKKKFDRLVVSELNNKRIIEIDKIIAIEAQRAYCNIYLENEKTITVSKHLGYFESTLPDSTYRFFRCHKSWLINLEKMESFSKKDKNILLRGGLEAKLSKYKIEELEAELKT